MANFYPILARAIGGLADKSPEARRSVYDRARTALIAQLRSLEPPLSEADITRERLALDEAVSRIEAEIGLAEAIEPPFPPVEPAPVPAPAEPEPAGDEPAVAVRPEPARPDEPLPDTPDFQDEQPVIRPRVAPREPRRLKPVHIRTAIVGAGVALAVTAIAGAAIYVNKINPTDPSARTRTETSTPQAQQEPSGKITERVGGEVAPQSQRGANGQSPPAQPGVAVAQRAVLYVEVPENPQQPRAVAGRAFWRLDSDTVGQGQPVETIVRATVEVPDAGITLDFTIRRNMDNAFPASHIIGMRFKTTGEASSDAIREVGVPQFKTDENERGAPLSAIASALGENLFVSALSNVKIEAERNVDLMRTRPWIDIPVRFASGRRGIITFEKGIAGAQTITDALNRWND